MIKQKIGLGLCCAVVLALSGCSRQQSDWQKTRETNTSDAYEQFLKKYPSGEFTAQAQARVKELYEERDWQKARDADTPEAYQAFLKQYPEGKWTEEARIRVENFTLAQAPSGSAATGTDSGAAAQNAAPAANPAEKVPPPAPAPKAARPPSPAADQPEPHAAASPPLKGSYGVQLGAFKSGAVAANKHWADLQKEYPSLLVGLSSKVVPKKTTEGNLYKLQATGLTEKHAREVCSALKAKSQACVVVPPARG
ncbi:MAG TPA: SPOR domain-containing protein [Steroidobacteraceae bacterium]|jgi:cell division protein FtsN